MNDNLIGTITSFKIMGIKPNFSALAKQTGKDRHTIAKMFKQEDGIIEHKKKGSVFDKYKEDIKPILKTGCVSIKSTLWYINTKNRTNYKYDAFKKYVQTNKLKNTSPNLEPHPLYETEYGDMLQCDWVENIKLHFEDGSEIIFNLYSATLGASRFHYFEYTDFKTEVDFKRCTVHCFKKLGGLPKRILTDNMSALVQIRNNDRIKHQSVIQFEKDIGVPIEFCRVRTPQTKGKDEVSNKYAQWLYAFDYKIKNKEHLLRLIDQLNIDCNRQVNTATHCPPVILFYEKEKQTLRPLPNNNLLLTFERNLASSRVPSTCLINVEGGKYSVPPNYISKVVEYIVIKQILYIYFNNEIIAQHKMQGRNTINYSLEHYKSCIASKFKDQDDIEKIAKENLERFKNFGEHYE